MGERDDDWVSEGITLRDWFAGQALTGLIDRSIDADWLAVTAYEIADALMAERDKIRGIS